MIRIAKVARHGKPRSKSVGGTAGHQHRKRSHKVGKTGSSLIQEEEEEEEDFKIIYMLAQK